MQPLHDDDDGTPPLVVLPAVESVVIPVVGSLPLRVGERLLRLRRIIDQDDVGTASGQHLKDTALFIVLLSGKSRRAVAWGGIAVRINPERHAPHLGDLKELLYEKWVQQRGRCALCGGRLIPLNSNPMLKLSPDRIDSEKGAYMKENLQITHLACNLAKNRFGGPQFAEFVEVLRGTDGN